MPTLTKDTPESDAKAPLPPSKSKLRKIVGFVVPCLIIALLFSSFMVGMARYSDSQRTEDSYATTNPGVDITITDYLKAMGYDMSKPIEVRVGAPISDGNTSTSCNLTINCNGDSGDTTKTPLVYPISFAFGNQTVRIKILSNTIGGTATPGHPYLVLKTDAVTTYERTENCSTTFWSAHTTCTVNNPPRIDPDELAMLKAMRLDDLFSQYAGGINAAATDVPL